MENTSEKLDIKYDSASLGFLKFLYARHDIYDKDWHSNLHAHNHTELFYIMKGTGKMQFSIKSCPVGQGDFIIINANVPHTEVSSTNDPLEYIVLGVRGLETLCGDTEDNDYVTIKSKDNEFTVLPLLKQIVYESDSENKSKESKYSTEICTHLLQAVFLYILRYTQFTNAPSQYGRCASKECASIRRYIDAHHKENITIDELANYAHISKYYMVHAFKEEYGITPIRYLQLKRITESKRLLRETTMSTSQIALVLGFSSPSHFTQCFKRLSHVSPSEYRRMSREEG